MARPLANEVSTVQAKVLRVLADRLDHGGPALPTDLEAALMRELEDREDLEDVRARRDEPSISLEAVKARFGL
jgi:hypothetical protein